MTALSSFVNIHNIMCPQIGEQKEAASEYAALVDRMAELELALKTSVVCNNERVLWSVDSPFQKIVEKLIGAPPYGDMKGLNIDPVNTEGICAYCGERFVGEHSLDDVAKHILTCEKHPMAALRVENERLTKAVDFVNALLSVYYPDMADIDGATFQDLAAQHGILVKEIRHEPCGEYCVCAEVCSPEEFEEGVTCYRSVAWLTAHPEGKEE